MKQKRAVIILSVLIALTLLFIWGRSIKSVEESVAESSGFTAFIEAVLSRFIAGISIPGGFIRKLAHFLEFGLLGLELATLIIIRRRVSFQNVINCLFAGLSAAVIDESIQILSNRGSQLQDVLLDFSGLCAAIFTALFIRWIILLLKKKPEEKSV